MFFYYCDYSAGLHISHGGALHYTSFGFQQEGNALSERWSMHIAEDGTSSYLPAADNRRVILWGDIEHLFVRKKKFRFILFYLFYFCQGPEALGIIP